MIKRELTESEAAVELNAILDNMSTDIIVKIPREIILHYNNIASKTYKFSYDKNKNLNEQNLSETTKKMLVDLYDKYIYDEEESRRLAQIEEKEKAQKYNVDVFANKNSKESKALSIVNEKQDGFFKRMWKKLKFWEKI